MMHYYKANDKIKSEFQRPNSWMRKGVVKDESGMFLPDIEGLCWRFFDLGRTLKTDGQLKSIHVAPLPFTSMQDEGLCLLVSYESGDDLLASPLPIPWLKELEPQPATDTRRATARNMVASLIDQTKDTPVLRNQLEDILTVMDGGTVTERRVYHVCDDIVEISKAAYDLHRELSRILDPDDTPSIVAIQTLNDARFEVVKAWAQSMANEKITALFDTQPDTLQNLPEELAAINAHRILDLINLVSALHSTPWLDESEQHETAQNLQGICLNDVRDWNHDERRKVYNWAVNNGAMPECLKARKQKQ